MPSGHMPALTLALVAAVAAAAAAPRAVRAQGDTAAAPPAGAFTDAQAERGAAVFRRVCGQCHVVTQFSGMPFRRSWTGRTAFELYELIRTTMPNDNPGRLPRQSYADVLAYVFKLNGLAAGSSELASDTEALRRVIIQPAPQPRY